MTCDHNPGTVQCDTCYNRLTGQHDDSDEVTLDDLR